MPLSFDGKSALAEKIMGCIDCKYIRFCRVIFLLFDFILRFY